MKIGAGLPAAIPNNAERRSSLVLDWARKAEELGFSSLGLIDRIVYPNYEPLVTLAVAAGVTQKIRLMTTILLAPVRETVLLAKQAATIDQISNGRLTLGLGIGSRSDDFEATSQKFETRGRRFEKQLALLKEIWEKGKDPGGGAEKKMGPLPIQNGGPELLIGGYIMRAIQRVAKWANGYISGSGGDLETVRSIYEIISRSWEQSKKSGKPRLVCCFYFGIGEDAKQKGAPFLLDYYGKGYGQHLLRDLRISKEQVKQTIEECSQIGADEIMFWPTIPELEQLELLSHAVL